MSDLRDWLRSNKLEQYAEMFEAHDIDVDILPDLSDVDLEKLGISLGNRRRLMKAIAERAIDTGESMPKAAAESSGQAERRHLTVWKMAGQIRYPSNNTAAKAKPVGGQIGVALGCIEAS